MEQPLSTQEEALKKELKKGKKEIGFERVRLALERLQLAWLRTAITFVALGFTAYRYYLSRVEDGLEPLAGIFNGRNIGLFLLVMAFIGLIQSILQHTRTWKRLKALYSKLPYSVALLQSYFVLALTFILILVVLLRLR